MKNIVMTLLLAITLIGGVNLASGSPKPVCVFDNSAEVINPCFDSCLGLWGEFVDCAGYDTSNCITSPCRHLPPFF